jgi:hypothetical protein
VDESNRVNQLKEEIKYNKEINPLIVYLDDIDVYILEGLHRYYALQELGIESFPAKVVLDLDSLNLINESHQPVEFSYRDALRVEKAALKFYGQTDSFRNTGYITPSGRLLNFGEGTGSRVHDHRNIGYVLDTLNIDIGEYGGDKWKNSTSWGMYAVMDMGFIRYLPESQTIDMHQMPTQEQFQILRQIIQQQNGKVNIEMNEDAYVMYEYDTPEDYIIDGIKSYYNEGIKPKLYMYDEEFD